MAFANPKNIHLQSKTATRTSKRWFTSRKVEWESTPLPESSGHPCGEVGAMDDDAPLSNLKNVNIKSSAVDDAGQPSFQWPQILRSGLPGVFPWHLFEIDFIATMLAIILITDPNPMIHSSSLVLGDPILVLGSLFWQGESMLLFGKIIFVGDKTSFRWCT